MIVLSSLSQLPTAVHMTIALVITGTPLAAILLHGHVQTRLEQERTRREAQVVAGAPDAARAEVVRAQADVEASYPRYPQQFHWKFLRRRRQ